MSAPEFVDLDENEDLGANAVLRAATMWALYQNMFALAGAGEGAPRVVTDAVTAANAQVFSSSGVFDPSIYPSGEGLVAHFKIWAAGGSGSHGAGSSRRNGGGGGGGYLEIKKPLADISGTVSVTVGAGGGSVTESNGQAGGNSFVTINGVDFGARGGLGGTTVSGLGEATGGDGGGFFLDGSTVAGTTSSSEGAPPHLNSGGRGGSGGPSGSNPPVTGRSAFYGGAGGGSTSRATSPDSQRAGGVSARAGDGGGGQLAGPGVDGGYPAGGGGAGGSGSFPSGAGANGLVIVEVWGVR